MALDLDQPQAGPSPLHESLRFRHWRYSPSQLHDLRSALNAKSVEVVARNTELEKQAQISLGHAFTDPPPPTAYLSVEDELLLVRFYCSQASTIARQGFGLPEVVEATAMTYLKRFYLKNSVMEWHPKTTMPTCLYLAAKTTNYPVPMDSFISKFAKCQPCDILDTEFLVAQSLSFEFWVRGPEKALRGWALELQSQPGCDTETIQRALPGALSSLSNSRRTDAEFIYTPSQISLACFRIADRSLVDGFLEQRYNSAASTEEDVPYGMEKGVLLGILEDVESMINQESGGVDLKKVKEVDKRLRTCSNPEKVPGTALYIKRKQEQEASAAAEKAVKTQKLKQEMSDRETVFGDVIQPRRAKTDKTDKTRSMSPRVTIGADLGLNKGDGNGPAIEASGMGVKDEAMGILVAGKGLEDVGKLTEET